MYRLPIPPTSIGQNNSPSFSPLRRLSRKWRQLKIAVSLLATLENCNRSSLRHHLFMIVCHHLPSIVITILTIIITITITITISLETPTSSPRPSKHRNLTQMPLMQTCENSLFDNLRLIAIDQGESDLLHLLFSSIILWSNTTSNLDCKNTSPAIFLRTIKTFAPWKIPPNTMPAQSNIALMAFSLVIWPSKYEWLWWWEWTEGRDPNKIGE